MNKKILFLTVSLLTAISFSPVCYGYQDLQDFINKNNTYSLDIDQTLESIARQDYISDDDFLDLDDDLYSLFTYKYIDDMKFLLENDEARLSITKKGVNNALSCVYGSVALDVIELFIQYGYAAFMTEKGITNVILNNTIFHEDNHFLFNIINLLMNDDEIKKLISRDVVNHVITRASFESVLKFVELFMADARTKKFIRKASIESALDKSHGETTLSMVKIFMSDNRTKKLISKKSVNKAIEKTSFETALEVIKIFFADDRTKNLITEKSISKAIEGSTGKVILDIVREVLQHNDSLLTTKSINKAFSYAFERDDFEFIEFLIKQLPEHFYDNFGTFVRASQILINQLDGISEDTSSRIKELAHDTVQAFCYIAYHNEAYHLSHYMLLSRLSNSMIKTFFDIKNDTKESRVDFDVPFIIAAKQGNLKVVEILAPHVTRWAVNKAFSISAEKGHFAIAKHLATDESTSELLDEEPVMHACNYSLMVKDHGFADFITFLKKNKTCKKFIDEDDDLLHENDLGIGLFGLENVLELFSKS